MTSVRVFRWAGGRRLRALAAGSAGQSLVEVAAFMPIFILLLALVMDFGYFFIAAAAINSAASSTVSYSVQGFSSPLERALPATGPTTLDVAVSTLALAAVSNLINGSTTTAVQICSKASGMNGNIPVCTSYGVAGTAYTPAADPEAPTFVLHRVDITYTVNPPVPLSFFKYNLLSSMQFHRQVSMRALD